MKFCSLEQEYQPNGNKNQVRKVTVTLLSSGHGLDYIHIMLCGLLVRVVCIIKCMLQFTQQNNI